MRRDPKKIFHKKVMKIAEYGDYYLLNEIKVHPEDPSSPSIDHLLIGNKYFYLIYDYYFEGAVDAALNDDYWTYHKMDGTKSKIINPLRKSFEISDYFSLANSLDSSYVLTIVLINDDCFINPIKNTNQKINLATLSKLEKIINNFESQPIGNFDGNALNIIVDHFVKKKNNASE